MRSLASDSLQRARLDRDFHRQAGALPRAALEAQLAAKLRDPLADADEADAARRARLAHFIRTKTDPVIFDRHEYRVGQALQEHAARRGLRMPGDVGQRFLDDAVDA